MADTCPECGHNISDAVWNALSTSGLTPDTDTLIVPMRCPECGAALDVFIRPDIEVRRA